MNQLKIVQRLGSYCLRTHRYLAKGISNSAPSSEDLNWSYVQGSSEVPLRGITVGNLLQQRVELHPDREAAVFCADNNRITFSQLLEQSDKLAAGLLSLGLKKGDRVGIWGPNTLEWILTQYGTARAGLLLVNINPQYRPDELEFALNKVQCKALVSAVQFRTQNYYEMLFQLLPELVRQQPGKLNSHLLPDLKFVIMMGDKKFPGTLRFNDILEMASDKETTAIADLQDTLQFDEPINIQFTSGTTGCPKGATLSHHNIVNNSYFTGLRMDYHVKYNRICMPVPLYHCFGMVLGSLMIANHGATLVCPSPGFDAGATLKAVSDERCTSMYGVPTMFIDMLNHLDFHKFDLSSLYTGIMAGSPCPIETMKQVNDKMHMPQVTVCYGTTENSPVTFQSRMDDTMEKRVSTVGSAHPHVEAKVVDENGMLVPTGTQGELCTRGYTTMLGYWDDPDRTDDVIKPDRWYFTGDIGVIDKKGFCRIEGRIKDMIIRGGENVYPLEIEQVLYKHPKVKDVQITGNWGPAGFKQMQANAIISKRLNACMKLNPINFKIVGVPDKRLGEEICAWIQLKDGVTATEEEIKNFVKEKMARFKVPKYVQFVDEYPLTVTGKVQKFKIRECATLSLGLEHQYPQ